MKNLYDYTNTIKTAFCTYKIHTRGGVDCFKPRNWSVDLKLGDTIHLKVADRWVLHTVIEFVTKENFDGTEGALYFIDQRGQAKEVNTLLNAYEIERKNGSWLTTLGKKINK